ncbi:ABC transporter substrate-binding protein [Cohnella fermenti]|uniref:Ferrichrome ABC transporter substrate-binding protein n=1 Tax=Cohnella fermenti TaxID=2565925 RepID=A0A4S4BNX6_9BACL|nr:ABC transporter substrate-binding protein [Cohnella fermenti]THF76586.1 ferrichrome ABC transporter substrate-binding protein [Cohnella fermenti]
MRNKSFILWVSIAAIVIALAGCGNKSGTNEAAAPSVSASASTDAAPSQASPGASEAMRTVTDELGHEIEIPVQPQRILAPYLEDPLTALGVKPIAQWANGDIVQQYLQDQISDLPKVDFSAGGLDPEQAAAQAPDLIILTMAVWAENGLYEQYSKIAPTYVLKNGIQDWKTTLRTLGDLLDRSEQAERAVADYEAKAESAKLKLSEALGDQQVALLWPTGDSLYLLSELDYSGQLLYGDLGLKEPDIARGQSFQNISLEKLPDIGAGHILLITGYNDAEVEQLESTSIWKSLPAVTANRVHNVSWNHWMNNGPIAKELNLEDTLQALAPN